MQPEPPAPEANRARRHQHDLPALLLQARDGAGDGFEVAGIELSVSARHDSGAQLDDRAARCPQPFLLFAFQRMILYAITLSLHPAIVILPSVLTADPILEEGVEGVLVGQASVWVVLMLASLRTADRLKPILQIIRDRGGLPWLSSW